MSVTPAVSVVICTHGERQGPLECLVSTLGWQTLPFELVIALGPCCAALRALVERLSSRAKVTEIPDLNISRARNAGTRAAAGETIAFIDDDAVPVGRDWLERLTAPLHSAEADGAVAAVGGMVLRGDTDVVEFAGGATSVSGFQRFGEDEDPPFAPDGTRWIPRVPGGNCAFARKALEAVRGFDEQFAYYLDEADVCVRLVAAGYRVAYTPDAPIRHFAASSGYGPGGQRHRFPVARSDAYFMLRHLSGSTWHRAFAALRQHRSKHFVREGRSMLQRGDLTVAGLARFRVDCWRGLASGIWAAGTQGPLLVTREPARPSQVLPFVSRRVLVLDPGASVLRGDDVPARLGAWVMTLQRSAPGAAIAIGSDRVQVRDAPTVARFVPPPGDETADAVSSWPDGRSWGGAARWITALHRQGLPASVDALVWLGSPAGGALIAEGLGRRVALATVPGTTIADDAHWIARLCESLDDTTSARLDAVADVVRLLHCPAPPSSAPSEAALTSCPAMVARLFERHLVMEARRVAAASLLADPAACETALASIRHCLADGYPELALRVGRAVQHHLAPADPRCVEAAYHVAHALRTLGREGEALAVYESILTIGRQTGVAPPLVGGACFHLAVAARAHRQDDRALHLFEKCLEYVPDHAAARRAVADLRAGGPTA